MGRSRQNKIIVWLAIGKGADRYPDFDCYEGRRGWNTAIVSMRLRLWLSVRALMVPRPASGGF